MYKNMFLYEKTHNKYLKNDSQFFDALKTKYRNITGNCNLLAKVKFHDLEWSSPLINLNWSLSQKENQKPKKLHETGCLNMLYFAFCLYLVLMQFIFIVHDIYLEPYHLFLSTNFLSFQCWWLFSMYLQISDCGASFLFAKLISFSQALLRNV